MVFTCKECSESFSDEWLCLAHWEIYHNFVGSSNQSRPSVIQYAPPQKKQKVLGGRLLEEQRDEELTLASSTSVNRNTIRQPIVAELVGEALQGSSVRHFRIRNINQESLNNFTAESKSIIKNKLEEELKRLNFIKFGIVLDAQFVNVENQITPRAFICRNRSITPASDVTQDIEECVQELMLKITEHEARGSGWSLLKVDSLTIRVHKHGYGQRGSSYIPLPKEIANTHSCINIKNEDNECFRYSMLAKFVKTKPELPSKHYNDIRHKYNFNRLTYPVRINEISTFEKYNLNVSVNVYALDGNNVYPLRITVEERSDHTDLLLIKDGNVSHYVYIKNFNMLMSAQLSKKKVSLTSVCKRCLNFSKSKKKGSPQQWLKEHLLLCKGYEAARIKLPSKDKAQVSFKNIDHQYQIPIVVYADFEASLLPIAPIEADVTTRTKYQKHVPNSYCLIVKSTLSETTLQENKLSSEPKLYRGENAAKMFVDELYEITSKVEKLYGKIIPMKKLNKDEEQRHNTATVCFLCEEEFTESNFKCRDHDHLTGMYRGPACKICNFDYKLPKFIPVVFHNLSCYDAHFIIPELGRDEGKIDVLATTSENFISFSKKIGKLKLRFVDSYRFIPSSLATLSKNLPHDNLIETRKLVDDVNLNLVLRKGVFCYDYIDSLEKFNETSLPSKEKFYNHLLGEHISQEDYSHACNVWNTLNMRTIGSYSDFYVKLDTSLLCDVMEEFRKTCKLAYGIDPLHCYTSPGLAWQAMLKMTKCKLQLLTDIDMVLMIESAVRGGITQCVTRNVKANNKYMPSYDASKNSTYIGYFDANNLYGWAMSKPLPYDNFEWIEPDKIPNIESIPLDGNEGFIMEVDFEYPERLHDNHYDFPLLPKNEKPPNGKHNKLLLTLENKKRYTAHYSTIQQAIKMGLKITKIHRVLKFKQSYWLKSYIDYNTTKRAAAASSFEKDFYKLMNNAIFGKTLQNQRKHKNIMLVSSHEKLEKLVAKPHFKTTVIINENLVLVSMNKISITMNRPLYIGMSILDLSKTLMYDFHYNKMVNYYGRENIGIAYTDTDALLYWIKTEDMYRDLKEFPYTDEFDFSDYPEDHPNYDQGRNKKVLGKFKDEANGKIIDEFVGLMAKMYAFKTVENDVTKKAKGVKKICLKKDLSFDNYKRCLLENEVSYVKVNSIRSFNHQLYSISERKKALSSYDDKRVILYDGIHTLPYGHYSLNVIDL